MSINLDTIKLNYQNVVQYLLDNNCDKELVSKMIVDLNMTKRLPSKITIDNTVYKYDTQLKHYFDETLFFKTSSMTRDVEKLYNKMLNDKKQYKLKSNNILVQLQKTNDIEKQTQLLDEFKKVSEMMQNIDTEYQKQLDKLLNDYKKMKIKMYSIDEMTKIYYNIK